MNEMIPKDALLRYCDKLIEEFTKMRTQQAESEHNLELVAAYFDGMIDSLKNLKMMLEGDQ